MRLNIRAKMIGGFLVVIALLLVVAVISWNGLNQLDAAADHIVHEQLPEDQEVRDLELQLALQAGLYLEYGLLLEPEILHKAQEKTEVIHEESLQLEGQLQGEPELLAILVLFEEEYEEFVVEAEEFAALMGAGETAEGLSHIHTLIAEEEQMEAELAELAHLIELGVEQSFLDASAAHASAVQLMIVVSVVAVIAGLAIAFLLSRSISNGVTSVGRAIRKIASGDLTEQVDIKSSDEIGEMALAYGEMQIYIQEMAQAAESIADGDLSIEVTAKSEQDVLGNAFVGMVTNLRQLVGQVGGTAGNLADASSQLSTAADQAGQATQ
ncbi:MAG: HAMP domain-containing protein, partial [Chloroflexi bacterium]|nr:HAMP domain-containing protein [Chloroflexota bacterium]